ncbi:hypothetical protein D3C73_694020 [compost metagenome]
MFPAMYSFSVQLINGSHIQLADYKIKDSQDDQKPIDNSPFLPVHKIQNIEIIRHVEIEYNLQRVHQHHAEQPIKTCTDQNMSYRSHCAKRKGQLQQPRAEQVGNNTYSKDQQLQDQALLRMERIDKDTRKD